MGANPVDDAAPYRALMEAGFAEVIGFEPQPDALARLLAQKGPHETYLPRALGDGEPACLHLYAGSGFASLYPPDRGTVATVAGFSRPMRPRGTVPVETARLDDLDAVGPLDLLKIDVQGAELSVIANARAKLAEAVAVWTEVRFFPLYDGEPERWELEAELAAQGFRLYDYMSQQRFPLKSGVQKALGRGRAGQLIDGDALYLRDLRGIRDWTVAQCQALAMVGLGVAASDDLAAFAIAELERRGACAPGVAADLVAGTL